MCPGSRWGLPDGERFWRSRFMVCVSASGVFREKKMNELVSAAAAGVMAGVSLRLVEYALRDGYLKGIKIGGRWVIPAHEVQAWRERRQASAFTSKGLPDKRRRGVEVWTQQELVT
jgi:hypothetical protein